MRRIFQLAAVLGSLGLLYTYPRFQRRKREVLARLRAGSQIAHTPFGALEFAVAGKGQPVLVMHGSGGGYDQGLLLTKILDPERYQTVAISRPGYHCTPLATGRTPEAQADVGAALLDQLHIKQAVVLGISAGGPPSIQFALRHPDRCLGLVLLSAVASAIQTVHASPLMLGLLHVMMASDFLLWLMLAAGRQAVTSTMGDLPAEAAQDPAKKEIVDAIINGLFPASLWRDGTINDIEQVEHASQDSLAQITVPTLVIHETNDTLVPYAVAQHSASHIPYAQLVTIPGGSHLIVGTHKDVVGAAIDQFVSQTPI